MGALPAKGSDFSLVGCSTAPGFTFEDWEKGDRGNLLKQFPNAESVIKLLTDP